MKTILSIVTGAPVVLFALSWGAMSMSPPDYAAARGLMTAAAITAVGWYAFWLTMTDEPLWTRSLIGIGVGVVALGGLPWGLDWIGKRENSSSLSAKSSPVPSSSQPQSTKIRSLLDLYLTDFHKRGYGMGLELNNRADIEFKDHTKLRFIYMILQDYSGQSTFMSFYIPHTPYAFDVLEFIATGYKQYLETKIGVETGFAGVALRTKDTDLVFTGRIFIYHEDNLDLSQLGKLEDIFKKERLSPEFRGTQYALVASMSPRPLESEDDRRWMLLEKLRAEYIFGHDQIPPEGPPADWINDRLRQLGQTWQFPQSPPQVDKPDVH